MNVKVCTECGHILQGRTDKKFCGDACRNVFNNRRNSEMNSIVRKINNTLRRNRRILSELLSDSEKTTVHAQDLIEHGFNFRYFTNSGVKIRNADFVFCYEYGYSGSASDEILIVKKEK